MDSCFCLLDSLQNNFTKQHARKVSAQMNMPHQTQKKAVHNVADNSTKVSNSSPFAETIIIQAACSD